MWERLSQCTPTNIMYQSALVCTKPAYNHPWKLHMPMFVKPRLIMTPPYSCVSNVVTVFSLLVVSVDII